MNMLTTRRGLLSSIPAISILATNTSFAQESTSITGAGATFPRPLYERWAQAARSAIGIQLNYQSIGSGGGINQITSRTVDFGASDAPLSSEQLTERKLLQFPTVMGSVVLSFNLPGVTSNTLKLSSSVIADIFRGNITRWRDPRITSINPGVNIPNLPIGVCYRADGSGTTWVFTNYLSRVSEEWKNTVGFGTSVRWPIGNGARGNEGVSNIIRNTIGSIGYIENAYAVVNRMPVTQIQNKSGKFVLANSESFNSTAASANWNVPNFAADTINLDGENVWPITSPTFILLPKNPNQDKVVASRNVMKFFDWAYDNGSEMAERLMYIPLPKNTHDDIRNSWKREVLSPDGNPIFI
jgi:phosphate transport system substrate-binding protein